MSFVFMWLNIVCEDVTRGNRVEIFQLLGTDMLSNVLRHKGKLNNVENIPYFSVIKHGKKKYNLNALTL